LHDAHVGQTVSGISGTTGRAGVWRMASAPRSVPVGSNRRASPVLRLLQNLILCAASACGVAAAWANGAVSIRRRRRGGSCALAAAGRYWRLRCLCSSPAWFEGWQAGGLADGKLENAGRGVKARRVAGPCSPGALHCVRVCRDALLSVPKELPRCLAWKRRRGRGRTGWLNFSPKAATPGCRSGAHTFTAYTS